MFTLTLLSFIACSGDKEDTAIETEDTSVEETDTEDTSTEETDTEDTSTEETDLPVGTAQVRVVHLSPDAPAVDVYVNGEASGIADAPFLAATGFVALPPGEYSFAVAPAGTDFASAVPVTLDVTLADGDAYTAIAHGYLDTSVESNGFAITPFAADLSAPTDGTFRVQVVHAAAASAFAKVDIWNITDPANPQPLIPDFDYGEEVTTELPTNTAFTLGVDIDADATPDAVFEIPDSLTGFVGVYAVNDVNGAPSLLAHFEDGTSVQLTPVAQ
jgi:hypothetical protein